MRLMVSGGGTGGHIYPALAVINELKRQDPTAEVMYVGSQRGIESTIVPELGIPFKEMEIQGFKRSLSLENFKTVYLFLKSVHRAKKNSCGILNQTLSSEPGAMSLVLYCTQQPNSTCPRLFTNKTVLSG